MARKKQPIQAIQAIKEMPRENIYPLIGHTKQIEFLKQCIAHSTLPHAYLIIGPAHIGKERLALEFIGAMLGKSPCDLRAGIEYILVERAVDEKSKRHGFNISIEQIKELRSRLVSHSLVAARTIVLIRGAEDMNRSASNALLKTLEEPIPDTHLMLLADNEEQILPTVRSRCQIIRLTHVRATEIEEAILRQGVTEDAAHESASISAGLPGIAVTYAHDAQMRERHEKEVERFFAIFDNSALHDKFQAISSLVGSNRNTNHVAARENIHNALTVWELCALDVLFARYGLEGNIVHINHAARFEELSKGVYGATGLSEFIEKIENARALLEQNVNGRIVLENLLLYLHSYAHTT